MRTRIAATFLMLSSVAHASDLKDFVKNYNRIFDGKTPVCNSVKAPDADKPGYHIAEASKIDGTKEILRVPQNTLYQFKKVDGKFVAEFHSYRWVAKEKISKTEKSLLKLETTEDGVHRLNMYDINGNFQAGHAIGAADDGSVEFSMENTTAYSKNDNTEFNLYVIRASKEDAVIKYSVNDLTYVFSKEVQLKAEAETGKKFFSDKLDQNGKDYMGNPFTIEEIRELAKKYGIEAQEAGNKPWENCPLPTEEEIRAYQGNFAKTTNPVSKRMPSSQPKKKK